MEKEEKIKLFEQELSTITDVKLREFAEALLTDTEDWFYHEPASTSGKYHPTFSLGDGGLMRHTKCVVYFVNEFSRAQLFGITKDREWDLLRVAAIAHDIRKHDKDGKYVKEHPQKAAEFMRMEFIEHSKLLDQREIDYMCRAIESHMGIWGTPAPKTPSEWVLHTADLCASRKEINMDFEGYVPVKREEVIPKKEEPETPPTVDTYIFDYGKYKGKTIKEAAADDITYLEWIAKKPDFHKSDSQKLIIEYLAEAKK